MPQTFEELLAEIAPEVETALEALLRPEPAEGEIFRPERLLAAMRHAMLGGGKRLRPALLIGAGRLFGAAGDGHLRAALALECVHGYSLVHDDLPSMDDDDLRRGRPTVHRAFDEATAILAGDALLTLAFDVLASPETHADAAVRAELVLVLARAAGLGGMAGGQMLDLAAEGRFGAREPLNEAAILRLQAMKTGALIAAAAEMGAILGAASPQARAALRRYGEAIGAAFQIADDLLDVESSTGALGKAAGKDAAAGKATLVAALGSDRARAMLRSLEEDAITALAGFGPEAEALRGAARFVATRES
jgi:farnesyl diphosphate synthase